MQGIRNGRCKLGDSGIRRGSPSNTRKEKGSKKKLEEVVARTPLPSIHATTRSVEGNDRKGAGGEEKREPRKKKKPGGTASWPGKPSLSCPDAKARANGKQKGKTSNKIQEKG